MIITQIIDGLGNQLFRYAAGRRLAHKLKTKLKIDKSYYDVNNVHNGYELNLFNIKEELATPEDLQIINQKTQERNQDIGIEKVKNINDKFPSFMSEVLEYPDDVFLRGYWQSEKYFIDIKDIIKNEFILKGGGGKIFSIGEIKLISLHVLYLCIFGTVIILLIPA